MTVSPVHTRTGFALPTGLWPLNAARPKFGYKPYGDIFERVALTTSQSAVADSFNRLAEASTLDEFRALLPVLSHPDYTHLMEVKGRKPFHSPFTDLFVKLSGADQKQMIDELFENLSKNLDTTSRENTIDTLVDIYFYALRPRAKDTENKNQPRPLAKHLLKKLDAIITNPAEPLSFRRYTHHRLRNQLKILYGNFPIMKAAVPTEELEPARRELAPVLARPIAATQPRLVKKENIENLQRALLNPDPTPLKAMSESGEIELVIPEWGRVTGPDNTQHSNQAYTLEGHMLNCVAKTKSSPHYQRLTAHEKKLVTMASLLHDIGKRTGPANLKPVITPDRCHSLKSADVVWDNLPGLGFSTKDTRTIARVLRYHTVLGNTIMRTRALNEAVPPDDLLDYLADVLKTPRTLKMLQALTEGDVRSLSLDQHEFDAEAERRLADFGELVEERIRGNWRMKIETIFQDLTDTAHDFIRHLQADWAGFRSLNRHV